MKKAQNDQQDPLALTEVGAVPEFLKKPLTIFTEAEEIVMGDREQTYGHPAKNFLATAALWSAHIFAKYGIEVNLTDEDVAWMMVQLKQARSMHQYKRDNLVDGIGYIGCIQKIHDYRNSHAGITEASNTTIVTGTMGAGRIHHGALQCNQNDTVSSKPALAPQSDSESLSSSKSISTELSDTSSPSP